MPKIDKKYETARNMLIPQAEAYANKRNGAKCEVKNERKREEWIGKWNRDFHRKMNELAAPLLV
jgi:hypothetical protein